MSKPTGKQKKSPQAQEDNPANAKADNAKPVKVKGLVPSYAPAASKAVDDSFGRQAAAASMCHKSMLLGVPGIYYIPIVFGGAAAGALLIEPIQYIAPDNSVFHDLRVVGSTFGGVHADDYRVLPVNLLRWKKLPQQVFFSSEWHQTLHTALSGMLHSEICIHFGFDKPTAKPVDSKPEQEQAVSNVVDIRPQPKEDPSVPLSDKIFTVDGLYRHDETGVVLQSMQKTGRPRIIRIKSVPLSCEPLKGMAGQYCFAADIDQAEVIKNRLIIDWLRQVVVRSDEQVAA